MSASGRPPARTEASPSRVFPARRRRRGLGWPGAIASRARASRSPRCRTCATSAAGRRATADGCGGGCVYRSTELDKLAGADMAAFAALGIRSVYDLRTEAERTAQPDRLPPGTEYVVVDVLEDSVDAAPAQLFKVATDPAGGRGAARRRQRAGALRGRLSRDREPAERRRRLPPAVLGPDARGAPAGPLPLHHGQGPHRLGGGVAADAARRRRTTW